MRKQDLSPDRQQRLVPVVGHSGAFALIPPRIHDAIPVVGVERNIAEAQEALSRLQEVARHLPNPELITRTLTRREAVQSSRIEGTRSEISDVMEFESTGHAEGLPADVTITLNYVKALDAGLALIKEQGQAALNTGMVKLLHRELIGSTPYQDAPGDFRTIQNWIGGLRIHDARFVPPPAAEMQPLLEDLEDFLNYQPEGNAYLPIAVRMAIVHAQFETIHPFRDGNGRVGRLMLPLMLAAEGYPPIYLAGFLKTNQREYYDTLLNVQLQGKWAEWVSFLSQAVVSGCNESEQIARALLTMRDGWAAKLAHTRRDSSARKLAHLLIGYPVMTVNRAKELLDVSFVAANNAVQSLVAAGILSEPHTSRNRAFIADEVIELLNRPTATE